MEHISDFTIQSFRGLRDLKIEKLGQINLLVGNNNSGKTSVLEATSIFCNPFEWGTWYNLDSEREQNTRMRSTVIDRLTWVFPHHANNNDNISSISPFVKFTASGSFSLREVTALYEKFTEIVIRRLVADYEDAGVESEVTEERVNIHITAFWRNEQPTLFEANSSFQEEQTLTFGDIRPIPGKNNQQVPILPFQIVNPFSHRTSNLTTRQWSAVVEANLKSETIKLLQFFDFDIEDVDFIAPTENRQLISIKHKKLGRAPLYTFGDGLRRIFTLATTIPRVRGGMLLIDELETAIHTKALEKTFNWLVNACVRNDVQLIATTHSLEALDALLDASIDEHANLVVYRLQQEQQQTTATRFDKEMTRRLREDLGMELRY